MKISIAMATYNGANFLQEQLDSFVLQTYLPDELIVCDDSSTDETLAILHAFAKKAPFQVIISQNSQQLGYAANFNRALEKTSGDLVFLSDQDDVWYPDKIKTVVELAEYDYDSWLFMNDAELTDAELNSVGLTKLGQVRAAGLGDDCFVTGCCCAVRRDLLDLVLPIPFSFKSHDNWLVWFADGFQRRRVENTVLQKYRRHGSNESEAFTNCTSNVSPFSRYMRMFRSVISSESENKVAQKTQQLKIFLDGITKIKSLVEANDLINLEALHDRVSKTIKIQATREQVRRVAFPKRIILALKLLWRGDYSAKHGLLSFLRDVWG